MIFHETCISFRLYAPPLPEESQRCKFIDTKLNDLRNDAARLEATILENELGWRNWLDNVKQRIEDAKASSPVDHAAIHALRLRIAEEETLKSVASRDFLCLDWRDRWIGQVEVVIA